jgi:hypothetical protein
MRIFEARNHTVERRVAAKPAQSRHSDWQLPMADAILGGLCRQTVQEYGAIIQQPGRHGLKGEKKICSIEDHRKSGERVGRPQSNGVGILLYVIIQDKIDFHTHGNLQ